MIQSFLDWKFMMEDKLDGKNIEPSILQKLREHYKKFAAFNNSPSSVGELFEYMQSFPESWVKDVSSIRTDLNNLAAEQKSCEHGTSELVALSFWIMAQLFHEKLQISPFLFLYLRRFRDNIQTDLLVFYLSLSEVHHFIYGEYLPIVLPRSPSGIPHMMSQVLLPSTDGTWSSFWLNSNGMRNASYESDRLKSFEFTEKAFRIFAPEKTLREVNCTYDFQGEFGSCTYWAFGLGLYLLCNESAALSIESSWCERLSKLSRLHSEKVLQTLEKLIREFGDAISSSLMRISLQYYGIESRLITPLKIEWMKEAVQQWISTVNMLEDQKDQTDEHVTLNEVDEKEIRSFVKMVRTVESIPRSDPPRILELCTASFSPKMFQAIREQKDGFRTTICDNKQSCKYIVLARRFNSSDPQQKDRFRITAGITSHAARAGYGAKVCGIVWCEDDHDSYGIVVLEHMQESKWEPETVNQALDRMHNDGIMHLQLDYDNMINGKDRAVFIDFSNAVPFFHSIPPLLRQFDLAGKMYFDAESAKTYERKRYVDAESDNTYEPISFSERDKNVLLTWLSGMSTDEVNFIQDHIELYVNSFPLELQGAMADVILGVKEFKGIIIRGNDVGLRRD